MGTTQFDLVRRHPEAAVHNRIAREQARVRRDTSLVGYASRLTGQALRQGESALEHWRSTAGNQTAGATIRTEPPPVRPAEDGYVRRSPVQPVFQAANYRRRMAARAALAVGLVAAAAAGLYILNFLGILGR